MKGTFEYPLLMMLNAKRPQTYLTLEGELFARDANRLLRCRSTTSLKSWEIISENVNGELVEVGLSVNGDYFGLSHTLQNGQHAVTLTNLSTNEYHTVVLDTDGKFIFYRTRFFIRNKNWSKAMTLNGRIMDCEDVDEDMQALYDLREKELASVGKNLYGGAPAILRRINRLAINGDGRLVMNAHELYFRTHDYRWCQFSEVNRQSNKEWIQATQTANDIFTFADGSIVSIGRAGMLRLQSSNQQIPPVYIPTTLDRPLGFAAGDDFAGNEFYYKEPVADLIIKKPGNPEKMADLIRNSLHIAIFQAQEMVDAGKVRRYHLNDLRALKEQLDGVALTEIENVASGLTKTEVKSFYREYIQAFIDHVRHEA